MLYVLVFMQYIGGSELKYYQIAVFPSDAECQAEQKKAQETLVTHGSQVVACLEVNRG